MKLVVHRGSLDRQMSGRPLGHALREIEIGCRVPADSEWEPARIRLRERSQPIPTIFRFVAISFLERSGQYPLQEIAQRESGKGV